MVSPYAPAQGGALVLDVLVHGIPQPQGAMRRNPYGHGMHDANTNLKPWRDSLAHALAERWGGQEPLVGPVELVAAFRFPRPKSHYRTGQLAHQLRPSAPLAHTKRPDLDHLQRAVGDALKVAGVLQDDSLIACWCASKAYGPSAGVYLQLTHLN